MAKNNLKFTISAIDRTKSVFKGVGKSVKSLSSAVFSLKGALVGLGGAVVLRSIAKTNAQFEDLRSGLASVFGSIEEGNRRFREISDFATRTQFSVEDLTKSFITLKGAGIEPTEKLLTTFTDTSASAVDGLGVFEALTRVIARSVGGGLGSPGPAGGFYVGGGGGGGLGNDAPGEITQKIMTTYWDFHTRPDLNTEIIYK